MGQHWPGDPGGWGAGGNPFLRRVGAGDVGTFIMCAQLDVSCLLCPQPDQSLGIPAPPPANSAFCTDLVRTIWPKRSPWLLRNCISLWI